MEIQTQDALPRMRVSREKQEPHQTPAGMDWNVYIIGHFAAWCNVRVRDKNLKFRLEEFRDYAEASGMRQPDNANAWGAITRNALKLGIIGATKEYEPAKTKSAKARPVRVWKAKRTKLNQTTIFDVLGGK